MGIYSLKMALHKIWFDAMEKYPNTTLYGMAYRTFRYMDTNGNGLLSESEFVKGIVRITNNKFTTEDSEIIFNTLLNKNRRHMNVDDFIGNFRVDMSPIRLNRVLNLFDNLDVRKAGIITITDLDCSGHPEVRASVTASDWVARRYIKEILGSKYDYEIRCEITRQNFIEYYTVLSMAIPSDDMFSSIIDNAYPYYLQ